MAGQRLEAERKGTVKALLYCLRLSLTGIWLMRTGMVEANLAHLVDQLPRIAGLDPAAVHELIACKQEGGERARLRHTELEVWSGQLDGLAAELEAARDVCSLPTEPPPDLRRRLDDFVRRARTRSSPE